MTKLPIPMVPRQSHAIRRAMGWVRRSSRIRAESLLVANRPIRMISVTTHAPMASVAFTAPPRSWTEETSTEGGRLRVAHGVPVCARW